MFSGLKADPPRYALNADELRRIRQPALIIWGRKDIFMSVANGKSKAGLMPNARFEVVEGGHIPWLDNLERCVEPMQTFLSA
jgi:pimeloyl-ACP methyl ester carboxylesterase